MTKDQKWESFLAFWRANFRELRDSDGPPEWAAFVTDDRTELPLLKQAALPLAAPYLESVEKNGLRYAEMPNLYRVRTAYFALINERKQAAEIARYGSAAVCGVCQGWGYVWGVYPVNGDWNDPEIDFRRKIFDAHRYEKVAWHCPVCSPNRQKYSEKAKQALLKSYMPPRVEPRSTFYPPFVDHRYGALSGDQAIEAWVRRNYGEPDGGYPDLWNTPSPESMAK